MNRYYASFCQCLMFVGCLLSFPEMIHAAPVPPTECDAHCRMKSGPFQAGLADDPTAECWLYPDDAVCNNCQSTDHPLQHRERLL